MKWYVLNESFETRKIEPYNVLNDGFVEMLKKDIKREKAKTFDEVKKVLKQDLMYQYWCRAEYEIKVGGLFAKDDDKFTKIDIYSQVEPNLDIMTKYVMENLKIK